VCAIVLAVAANKLVRLPEDLAAAVAKAAKAQGVSENTLLVALIAGGLNFKLPKK
jgi:predicted HicB family RNase H-like nuclease